ncbi:DNA primase [Helicobacter sp. MIT 21-1697]|uniref:DNA primase n=1 Tax=Helicobacter sp. MIT 21-1697 TaxID=2993733 RepID=UPI00224A648B|nr:DNA primase [Helicobacter sp. MIT 21-1697]MCX2717096.1 DNA primase [Helicobacter sp. MIT 21-1697]
MISKHSIETLKQNIDIVDIIGSHIDLKKSGSNYIACCPFHNEKTPSFVISPTKGFYHCYGCGMGGDAIKFLMEYEKLSFVESVEKIAAMMNFALEYENIKEKKPDSIVLDEIMRFYQKQLLSHKPSLEYLASRQVANTSIEKFRLGYCGASFETINFLNAKVLNKQEALEFGVIGKDNGREYARFNDRIIFPIHSPNGKVVGFGGRTMSNANAKYINSPQSKIFNKSKLLYGYYLAKDKIYKQKKIIVCEGYLDVIMLHQAGFDYAVATLGTALTKEHLPLLRKGEPKVILSYDGDKAGINAAFKAAKILSEASIEGGVVIFENGADPADMVAHKQINELSELFSHPISFIEFILTHIARSYELENPLQKEKALSESTQFLHTLSPLLQEEYKPLLARLLSLPTRLIHTQRNKAPSTQPIFNAFMQDFAESVLIKSFLEKPNLIDFAIEYIDVSLFKYKKIEFGLVANQCYDDPRLLAISLNDTIKPLSDLPALKEHLRLFITQAYSQLLAQIPHLNEMSLQRKSEIIKELKTKILHLKKGELLPYVSVSTF